MEYEQIPQYINIKLYPTQYILADAEGEVGNLERTKDDTNNKFRTTENGLYFFLSLSNVIRTRLQNRKLSGGGREIF